MNYRKINLVVMNNFYKIIDRFNLDAITGLNGLGFKFNIFTIKSGTMEYLTNIIPENVSVKINILFMQPNAYEKYNSYKAFVMKYSAIGKKLLLEYNDTTKVVYADIRIEQSEKGERSNGYLTVPTTIKRLSPYFTWISNKIIKYTEEGCTYPLTYPYTYNSGLILNNEIKNDFIFPAPLIMVMYGQTPAPYITLSDDSEDNYQILKFKTGADLAVGDRLLIDSLTSQILYYPSGSSDGIDWFDNVDLDSNTSAEESKLVTHLFARSLQRSKIGITSLQPLQSGMLEVSYRLQVI